MEEKEELKATTGLKVLCFFIPLVGLIIYACNVSQNRKYANQCGKASVIGFLTPIIIAIISFIFIIAFTGINNYIQDTKEQKSYEELRTIMENS